VLQVTVYKNRAECEAAHQGEEFFHYCGPIHKHGEDRFVQLYQGQHEWLAVNVREPEDVRVDPGYVAVEYGWGHVARGIQGTTEDGRDIPEWVSDFCDYKRRLPEPESISKSITSDEILFAGRNRVEEHLGMTLNEFDQAKANADRIAQET